MRLVLPRLALVAAFALPLAAAGCDAYDGEDDGRVVVFSFDRGDATISSDGLIASFETDDIASTSDRADVEDALDGLENGGIVLLYADGSLIFDGGEGTWTALPVTRAYEATGTDGVPYVDYTVTYSYSYGDADLYFDVVSSAELDFNTVLPADIELQLVTLSASGFADARAGGVDLKSYAAVRQAFSLAE